MTEPKRTILFIDDEELMRDVASMMFEEVEWKAYFAASGKEGIDLYRSHQAEIDLAIIDFSMPEKNGVETALELRTMNPELPILIVSGLITEQELGPLAGQDGIAFLRKPFHLQSLLQKLTTFQ
ncbi:MAG: response regulator [Bdellovibrionales bacterium]|nr:response regulator [Bdellovibrionales bacterium]